MMREQSCESIFLDEDEVAVLKNTHEAVRAYARVEFSSLVRKVIYRLQRVGASGIYGEDYIYKTLWDEYCHEVQEGPHDLLEGAWEQTVLPILEDAVDRVPPHLAVLLSIFAAWELDRDDDPALIGAIWSDGVRKVLQSLLAEQAGSRSLDHLGPWRDC